MKFCILLTYLGGIKFVPVFSGQILGFVGFKELCLGTT
jgi:hypothetical protein